MEIVKMHQDIGFENCLAFHGLGYKKSRKKEQIRMGNDQLCAKWHKK